MKRRKDGSMPISAATLLHTARVHGEIASQLATVCVYALDTFTATTPPANPGLSDTLAMLRTAAEENTSKKFPELAPHGLDWEFLCLVEWLGFLSQHHHGLWLRDQAFADDAKPGRPKTPQLNALSLLAMPKVAGTPPSRGRRRKYLVSDAVLLQVVENDKKAGARTESVTLRAVAKWYLESQGKRTTGKKLDELFLYLQRRLSLYRRSLTKSAENAGS